MEFMIAGVDALLLSLYAVIVVIVLVCVLVGKFIMYAFGRLRGSGGDDGDTAPRELWERAPGCLALVKAASQLTLAEQLYLLAYDDVGSSVPRDATQSSLSSGLTGAVLLELFHRELVRKRPDGNVAVVERPGEVPSLLEDAMTAIRATKRSTEQWATGRLASELKPIKKTVGRSLVERGVLAEERGRLLGLIPRTRFPTVDPAPRSELLERVHAILLSAPRPDPTGPGMIQTRPRDPSEEEGQLLMLLTRLDLIGSLAPRDRHKQAIRRANQLDEQKRAKRRADHLAGQGCQLSAAQTTVWSVLSPSSYGYNGSGGC
jgi:hypothetical protein